MSCNGNCASCTGCGRELELTRGELRSGVPSGGPDHGRADTCVS